MNIVLWIVQALLGLAFLGAGYNKAFRVQQALAQPAMAWIADLPAGLVKFIGLAEVAGGVGLVLPMLLGVQPWLTPLAAALLALVMLLAFVFHLSRKEYQALVVNIVLFALAAFVAWGRWALFA